VGLTKAERWVRAQFKRAEKEVFTEKVVVTPQIAELLLARNPDNRKIKTAKLAQYIDDMKSGRWQFNGETVIVSKSGEVNDGQHRLMAVIKSGVPHELNIAFGVERDSRFTVDTGVARTAGDHMSLSGMQYGTSLASTARMVISYERAKGEHMGRPNEVSAAAVIERVEADELLRECAIWGHVNKKRGAVGRASLVGFVFYVLSTKNAASAKLFMQGLKDGIGLAGDSPIRITREKIISSPRLSTNQIIEIIFRGWNHWIEGNSVTRMAVQGTMPKPISRAPKRPKVQSQESETEPA
jgi:hypothetical protein